MVITQGDIWWADLAEPVGSAPGYRRPVVVIQSDRFNASNLSTVVVVGLTSNLNWAKAPGNALLTAKQTGLPQESVANITQLATIDRAMLIERAGKLRRAKLDLVLSGIDLMLGR